MAQVETSMGKYATDWFAVYDLDPFRELNLTDEQREDMNVEARGSFLDLANKAFEPYGVTLFGNGELVGPHYQSPDYEDYRRIDSVELDGLMDEIAEFWEPWDILEKYCVLAEKNEA